MPELRVASLIDDLDLLEMAREDAGLVVSADPTLEAPTDRPLRHELGRRFEHDWVWVSSG